MITFTKLYHNLGIILAFIIFYVNYNVKYYFFPGNIGIHQIKLDLHQFRLRACHNPRFQVT